MLEKKMPEYAESLRKSSVDVLRAARSLSPQNLERVWRKHYPDADLMFPRPFQHNYVAAEYRDVRHDMKQKARSLSPQYRKFHAKTCESLLKWTTAEKILRGRKFDNEHAEKIFEETLMKRKSAGETIFERRKSAATMMRNVDGGYRIAGMLGDALGVSDPHLIGTPELTPRGQERGRKDKIREGITTEKERREYEERLATPRRQKDKVRYLTVEDKERIKEE
jgi:hypothetical protein